jgi:hypothetical protein
MKICSYPFITITALLSVTVAVLAQPRAQQTRSRDQVLTTTDGRKVVAHFDGRGYSVRLRDGQYKTTNGGAIRVQGGKIVWDAFGAIEKLKHQGAGRIQVIDPLA